MPGPNKLSTREERVLEPEGKRTRTAESLKSLAPEGVDPETHFFHLSREHGLQFDRQGDPMERIYNASDAVSANEECQATCKRGRPSLRRIEMDQRLRNRPRSKKTVVGEDTSADTASTSSISASEALKLRVTQACKKDGLVTTDQIAKRYGKYRDKGTRGAFITRLKGRGLTYRKTLGKSQLYKPQEVDELCAKLGLQVVKEQPEWNEALKVDE